MRFGAPDAIWVTGIMAGGLGARVRDAFEEGEPVKVVVFLIPTLICLVLSGWAMERNERNMRLAGARRIAEEAS